MKGDKMFDTTLQDQLLKLIYIEAMEDLIAAANAELLGTDWF